MDASKGTKVEGVSASQLELLRDISGAFRPGKCLYTSFISLHKCPPCRSQTIQSISLAPILSKRLDLGILNVCRNFDLPHGGIGSRKDHPDGCAGRKEDRCTALHHMTSRPCRQASDTGLEPTTFCTADLTE